MDYISYRAMLLEIGSRVKAFRIDYPMTRAQLSEKSGVSIGSIGRLESGHDIQLGNLFRILIVLGLSENVDLLLPDPTKRPSYLLSDGSGTRKRVGKKTKSKKIQWGDDE